MISILVGGDIYPIGRIQDAFIEGNVQEIFHDLLDEIANADISVVNLECPLVSQETPIAKAGPVLGAHTKCVRGFAISKWDVLNLANNHSFDHGARGLRETIDTIAGAGLSVVGAGLDIKEAQSPLIKEINGSRIIIYAMAEREFSVADEKTPGANPLDLINLVNAIRLYKQRGTFIVLIHGGTEYYPYPSPEMVRRCRFMVDMGADAVICCHTHCPLPWEIYANRPIVYGLGNLIFESTRKEADAWHEGYLVRLNIEKQAAAVQLEVIPYFQSLVSPGAQKMHGNAQKRFFDEMQRKGAQVKDSAFLEDQWVKYCRLQKETYFAGLFGYNRLMDRRRSLLLKILHSKKEVLRALHLVQCEAHQEILNTIFKDERQEKYPVLKID